MSASDDSPAPARRIADDSDDESSSGDSPLFKYPRRGPFRRKVEKSYSEGDNDSEEEGKAGGRGGSDDDSDSDDDDDDDDMGGAFNSSPERRRGVRKPPANNGGRGAAIDLESILSSDDDDGGGASGEPVTKKRKVLTEAELEAQANAKVDELLASAADVPTPRAASKKDLDHARRMQKKLADAADIESGARTRGTAYIPDAASLPAVSAVSKATEERRKREEDKKKARIEVHRNKRQRHAFSTNLWKTVGYVEDCCRGELVLLSREEEECADIALFYKDKKLRSELTLREAGITLVGAKLQLEVSVVAGGGGGGGASGPPITLKVRVEGGKTFKVNTSTEIKFSAFMEAFSAKVGIPPERASEGVFKFDGDRLNPDGTPEGEDMESDDLIEAKFPADLMDGVQTSPSDVTLSEQRAAAPAGQKGGKGAAARSRAAAALAAAAKPLGGGGSSRSPKGGAKRSTRGSGGSSAGGGGRGARAKKQPEVVVLD